MANFPTSKRLSRQLRRLAVALAVPALLLLVLAAPASAKREQLYWGAQIGPQMTGEAAPWDMRPVHRFQRLAGKGLSLIEFGAPWSECAPKCVMQKFPTTPMENIRSYGAIPAFSWGSEASPPEANQSRFRLSNIIRGRLDNYIRSFASEAAAWGHPFFLRFNWEMNGDWFPWGASAPGNSPHQVVAAWRHVHDIFDSVGATNATWVWCPNVDLGGEGELASLASVYPGSRYVDWTCLDGFNWGVRHGSPGWLSFSQVFGPTYKRIVNRIAPNKPMMIAETASTDKSGNKAAWIKNALHVVRTKFRKIRGFIWYDVNDRGTNWPLETSKQASNAFKRGVSSAAFRPNEFGDLAARPIQPPR